MTGLDGLMTTQTQISRRRGGNRGREAAVADRLLFAMMGFMGGQKNIRQKKKDDLDRYAKLLEAQERLARIETERMKQEQYRNGAKFMSLLPLSEAEEAIARGVAHQSLGGDKAPAAHTQENRLMKFLDENEGSSVSFGPGGFRFTLRRGKKDKSSEKDPYTKRAAAMRLAAEAAAREIEAKEGPDPITGRARAPRNDEVMKFLPAYQFFLSGDEKGYKTEMERMRKASDPFDLLGGGSDPFGGNVDLDLEDEP